MRVADPDFGVTDLLAVLARDGQAEQFLGIERLLVELERLGGIVDDQLRGHAVVTSGCGLGCHGILRRGLGKRRGGVHQARGRCGPKRIEFAAAHTTRSAQLS